MTSYIWDSRIFFIVLDHVLKILFVKLIHILGLETKILLMIMKYEVSYYLIYTRNISYHYWRTTHLLCFNFVYGKILFCCPIEINEVIHVNI